MKNSILIGFISGLIFMTVSCHQSTKKTKYKADNQKENLVETDTSVILSNKKAEASCVYLTTDQKNTPIISWVEIDTAKQKHFYFSKFDTQTLTFSEKKEIPIEQNASIHEEGMPKIAVKKDGGYLATYETSTLMKGSKWGLGDIKYIQSYNKGKTWTKPKSVAPEDIKNKLSGSFSNITRLSDGEIGIAWLGTTPPEQRNTFKGRPIKFAKTNGDSLSKPITIDPQGCECCRTAITSINDKIFVAYRDLIHDSIRDISFAVSKDNGLTFEKPNTFSHDNWVLQGCPHNGPSIQNDEHNAFITWFSDGQHNKGVNLAKINADGKTLNRYNLSPSGQFIQVDLLKKNEPIVTYSESYHQNGKAYTKIMINRVSENKIFAKRVSDNNIDANYPVIKRLSDSTAIVGWSQDDKIYYKIINTQTMTQVFEDINMSNL